MKYSYSKTGYHPRNVYFEVSALLMEEEKRTIDASLLLFNNLIVNHYNPDGYSLEKELAFNPVTNQKATFAYVNHDHRLASIQQYLNSRKLKKKESYLQKLGVLNVLHSMAKEFRIVVQHLFGGRKAIEKEHTAALLPIFNTGKSVHKIQIEKPTVTVQYMLHPHVQALLNERSHSGHGRYR